MNLPTAPVIVGHLVVDEEWSLDEVCRLCAVEREWMVELVAHGALELRDGGAWQGQREPQQLASLRFGADVLRRVSLAARLHRDLGVNIAGVALTMELLERIDALERELSRTSR